MIQNYGNPKGISMIILGLVLVLLGWLLGISALETIGLILLIVGIILNLVPIRGQRRRYW